MGRMKIKNLKENIRRVRKEMRLFRKIVRKFLHFEEKTTKKWGPNFFKG
jgi:hypothetical protein